MGKRSAKQKKHQTPDKFMGNGKQIKLEQELEMEKTEAAPDAEPLSDNAAQESPTVAKDGDEGESEEIVALRSTVAAWLRQQTQLEDMQIRELHDESLMVPDDPEQEQEPEQVNLDSLDVKIRTALLMYSEHEKRKSFKFECEWGKCKLLSGHERKYFNHVESHAELAVEQMARPDGRYSCEWDLCDFTTADSDEFIGHVHYHAYHTKLKVHGASMHMLLRLPNCNIDSRVRNTISNRQVTFRCEWENCEQRFNKALHFFYHMRNHVIDAYPSGQKSTKTPTGCRWPLCKTAYKQSAILLGHVRLHTTEREIACFSCGVTFYTRQKYLEHCARQLDLGLRKYQCGECGRTCATRMILRAHMEKHNKPFLCTLCPMKFGAKSALASHMGQRHMKQRNFQCQKCEYAAFAKRDLVNHMLTVHEKKLYRCEEFGCNVAYRSESAIKRHINWHYNLPPTTYGCHLCDKQYKTHGNRMSKHLHFVHKLERAPGMRTFRYLLDTDGVYRLASYVTPRIKEQLLQASKTDGTKHVVLFPTNAKPQEQEQQNKPAQESPTGTKIKVNPKIKAIKAIGAQEFAIELDMDHVDLEQTPADGSGGRGAKKSKVSTKPTPTKRAREEDSMDDSDSDVSPPQHNDGPKTKNVQDFKVMKRYLKLSKTTRDA
uniref:C2H2-type domain-containing protein n=1 Tax=Anopheles dirus TaxID=7168 RepID=A0A2C9GV92_9DIPT